jgi:hypothetical protein
MLLHAMPALVLADICNDLYLNCRCDFQCFCIPTLVVVAICNALPRLRYLLLLFAMCLHTRVSFVLLFTMILHGCVHFYGYLHVVVCISVLVFAVMYNDVAWLRSCLLLFAMLLHTIPALVLDAICSDLCMNCSCELHALVVVTIYHAFERLRVFVAVICNVFAYPR